MWRRKSRIILASENPQVRHFLEDAVRGKAGAVIVGEAESAGKTLGMAKKLRPDIAIIDSYLPHNFGIDSIPLSRIGGLDTAQILAEDMPGVRVVLVTNTEKVITPRSSLGIDLDSFSPEQAGKLRHAHGEKHSRGEVPRSLSFTSIETKPEARIKNGVGLIDTAIFAGGITLVAGMILIATMIFAVIGAPLAALGGAVLFFSCVVKLLTSLRRELNGKFEEPPSGKKRS